jgi:flagellar motor switch protein FliN/FliY
MNMPETSMQEEFVARWAKAIEAVLSQIAGKPWNATRSASATSSEEMIVLQFTVAKALSGRVQLRINHRGALRLVSLFTGAEPATEWNNEQQEAIEELARQFAGQLAVSLKPDLGEVELRLETTPDFAPAEESSTVLLSGPQGEAVCFGFQIDETLKAALSPAPASVPAIPLTATPESSGNLDLLMDVELAVTLRFGQRQMVLQDILDLQSGSVIELDREIQEPVDLLLDGRVIARGNVVVVDGNYGLRVSEVGSNGGGLA